MDVQERSQHARFNSKLVRLKVADDMAELEDSVAMACFNSKLVRLKVSSAFGCRVDAC